MFGQENLMEKLTFWEIIYYHREIIMASDLQEDPGPGEQLLNTGNPDFIVTFSNNFSDPFGKAAFVLHGPTTGHAFVQGNKRIAFLPATVSSCSELQSGITL